MDLFLCGNLMNENAINGMKNAKSFSIISFRVLRADSDVRRINSIEKKLILQMYKWQPKHLKISYQKKKIYRRK